MRWGRLVGCGLLLGLWGGAAHAAESLQVLVDGYSIVQMATEWEHAGEEFYVGAPQVDAMGNVYQIAGGSPGEAILRSADDGVEEFLRVTGQGRPRVVAFWFDHANDMIVVVRRLAPTPEETRASRERFAAWGPMTVAYERVYYKIKGFPSRFGESDDSAADGLTTERMRALGLLVVFMTTGMLVMWRQLRRDLHALRRR